MKIIIREWRKDPIACLMLLGHIVTSGIYYTINAKIIILISSSIMDLTNWKENLTKLIIVLIANTIITMVGSYFRSLCVHHCFVTLNNLYTDKILDADVDMFTTYSCSHIITIAEYISKITNCGMLCATCLLDFVRLAITFISIWIIGGWIIIPIIIIYGLGSLILKKLFYDYKIIDKKIGEIKRARNQETEDIINGFMDVRSFNTQEHHRKSIHKYNDSMFANRKKKAKLNITTNASFEIIDAICIIAIIIFSIKGITAGAIVQTQAMSLVMFVFNIINPIASIIDFFNTFSDNLSMIDNYDEIISYNNKCIPDGSLEMNEFKNSISLENIEFAYKEDSTILKGLYMNFPKGKKIGICGVSGGGKSTIFKLLNKFYDADNGSIFVDGIDVHNFTKESYRKHLACVHQENIIFPGSIKKNILYGNFNVPEYEMVMACKKANIYDFIMSLPDKFDTIVGPRGLTLSGGQKQKIALARLFLSNPDIILLDEATSALDNESETFIQDAIDALPDKTIITIAHRLSTIKNSDIIYVLGNNGVVVEQGTHEELMEMRGVYYDMNK